MAGMTSLALLLLELALNRASKGVYIADFLEKNVPHGSRANSAMHRINHVRQVKEVWRQFAALECQKTIFTGNFRYLNALTASRGFLVLGIFLRRFSIVPRSLRF